MVEKKNLSDLKSVVKEAEKEVKTETSKTDSTADATTEVAKPKLDAKGRAYATGRRKEAVARVWLSRGSGRITVNGKDITTYFARANQRLIIGQPFKVADRVDQFDINCTVSGSGPSGQAGAIRHGITRALTNFEPELRAVLKKAGLLTRDARKVERKKYGLHKARKSTQWVKR